jgi:hypothetical protein
MAPYLPLQTKSTIGQEALTLAMRVPPEQWVKYFNFDAIPLPYAMLMQDPTLAALSTKREFRAGVLRLPPYTAYNWHVDDERRASINMLLRSGRSHCLFADEPFGLNMRVQELDYAQDTYYVFNTQVPHMVLNLEAPRYMFTLEFTGKDKYVMFNELCGDLADKEST